MHSKTCSPKKTNSLFSQRISIDHLGIVGKYLIMSVRERRLSNQFWIARSVTRVVVLEAPLRPFFTVNSCLFMSVNDHQTQSPKTDCSESSVYLCIHIYIMYMHVSLFTFLSQMHVHVTRNVLSLRCDCHSTSLSQKQNDGCVPFCPIPWFLCPLSTSPSSSFLKSSLSCQDLRNC